MTRILLVLALMLAAVPGLAETAKITVTGEGRANAVPDMAEIRLGVLVRARAPQAASSQMAAEVTEVIAALDAQGLAAADMQTTAINLQPVYETRGTNRRSEIVGFEASSDLAIIVRDLDRLGAVLDAVIAVGADRLNGLQLTISDPAPLLAEARTNAVADARLRAETYAAAAGLTLGPVLDMREGGSFGGPRPEMMMSARMADMPVAAGTLTQSAQVTVTYALMP